MNKFLSVASLVSNASLSAAITPYKREKEREGKGGMKEEETVKYDKKTPRLKVDKYD